MQPNGGGPQLDVQLEGVAFDALLDPQDIAGRVARQGGVGGGYTYARVRTRSALDGVRRDLLVISIQGRQAEGLERKLHQETWGLQACIPGDMLNPAVQGEAPRVDSPVRRGRF